jgi:PAS domain S-box-containing protein
MDRVFENIMEPIIVANEGGIIVNMNPSAEKMIGKPLSQFIGVDIRECLGEYGIYSYDILDSNEGRYEVLRTIHNEDHHLEIIISRLMIKMEIPVGWVLMFRDITHEKQTQKILVSSKDTLAKMVDEKSVQLQKTVTSLRKEVEMRQEIENKVLDEWKRAEFYLDLLNHDMSNINQDMLSRVQIMGLHEKEGSVFRSHLDDLEMSLKRSIKLIRNVKTLNRLSSMPLVQNNVELVGTIQKIIYQLKKSAKTSKVDIILKIDEKEILAQGGRQTEEIFKIVIENGIEIQEKGKGKVTIKISQNPDDDRYIRTEISDHGPGIPDNVKLDLLNREKRMGDKMLTGVSLLLARILTERYGGKIKIEDRIKGNYRKGASFIIDLRKACSNIDHHDSMT